MTIYGPHLSKLLQKIANTCILEHNIWETFLFTLYVILKY